MKLPDRVVALAARVLRWWPWAARIVNRVAIDRLVNSCRARPHPWSTVHDYVSWTSLTDRTWSARHLPAVDPVADLPPVEEVVGLFARGPDDGQRLCEKSTVLFPAFAQYLTDGFIRTRMPVGDEGHEVRLRNDSNHEIDLCPLYGLTPAHTAALRLGSEERGRRGRLKSQMIGDEEHAPFLYRDGQPKEEFRALGEPLGINRFPDPEVRSAIFAFGGDRVNTSPPTSMVNTLLLREHNRLAGAIDAAHPTWGDERVFQTARNAVIVQFITIVVEEYINHINPLPIRFRADPSVAWRARWNRPNWITTEFSLLYRWHSLVPDVAAWNGRPVPVHQTFMDNRSLLERGLAASFVGLSGQRAARLGAFNTTEHLLPVETAAIEQGRRARLAPYADYREYVGQRRPRDFSDISTDPAVVSMLESLYRRPDDVELYVGLFAEDPVRNSPLPRLILTMVAVDAFSQALTNPLLSPHVFNDPVSTFSEVGWAAIGETSTLRDLLDRNCPGGIGDAFVGMTRQGWAPR